MQQLYCFSLRMKLGRYNRVSGLTTGPLLGEGQAKIGTVIEEMIRLSFFGCLVRHNIEEKPL